MYYLCCFKKWDFSLQYCFVVKWAEKVIHIFESGNPIVAKYAGFRTIHFRKS